MEKSTPFLDFHTHIRQSTNECLLENEFQHKGTFSVYSLGLNEVQTLQEKPYSSPFGPCSVGLHPWEVNEVTYKNDLDRIENVINNEKVIFIGECGLDKWKGGNFALQKEVYLAHIRMANKVNKPLILHCVKAFDELISLNKVERPHVPQIIHGFNKSPDLAKQLINKGFFLSFGQAIKCENGSNHAAESLIICFESNLPFFLETDQAMLSIEDIYEQAANILKISKEALKDVIFANWKKIGVNHE